MQEPNLRLQRLHASLLTAWGLCFFNCAFAGAEERAKPDIVIVPQIIRPLPGALDQIPVFNSNSPEIALNEGVLLSTFPQEGKKHPDAHLNYPLEGRFDIFAHHVAKSEPGDHRTLFLGIVVANPGKKKVRLDVLSGASYLSQPDAPFVQKPAIELNDEDKVFSGPGDRVTCEVLSDRFSLSGVVQKQAVIPPGKRVVLFCRPIPVRELTPALNGRSTLMKLKSTGPLHVASLALFGRGESADDPPTAADWSTILDSGELVRPRDKVPTRPDAPGAVIYGRVAGVALGSRWNARVTDASSRDAFVRYRPGVSLEEAGLAGKSITDRRLTIPRPGESISYPFSTVARGTFGTGQIQSAPMTVRYPDTAYAAHGNYCVWYHLELPLYNGDFIERPVTVKIQFPIKSDEAKSSLAFYEPTSERTFFRGSVIVKFKDDEGKLQESKYHLTGHHGEHGQPLVELNLEPGSSRLVQLDFMYPPDSTPPQVVTVETGRSP